MMNYLITGATGELGGYALNYLKEHASLNNIVALARTEEKAIPLREQGFNVRIGDFDDYSSLVEAFTGIDHLLFISSQPGGPAPRDEQHQHVVKAAKETGISFIAYTSFPKGAQSKSPLAQDHIATEKLIVESGIPHSFLRNNWYIENESDTLKATLAGFPFTYSAGEGKVGWALKREFAEAAVNVLTGQTEPKEVFELSGSSNSYGELAKALKIASQKDFDIQSMDDDQYKEVLMTNNVPEATISFILMIQNDIRTGQLDVPSTDFELALGKPLTPLVDALKEFLTK